ncbi:MAG: 30S ribosomal protein S6 [bacterium]
MSKTKKTSSPYYELLYIISNKFTEDEAKEINEKVEGVITQNGAVITYREDWGKKKLAYPIGNFSYGYYRYMEFDATPELMAKIERTIKLMSEVLRHQILKRSIRTADLQEKPKPMFAFEAKKKDEEVKNLKTETVEEKAIEEKEIKPKKAKSTIKDSDNKVSIEELDFKLEKILETNDLL